MNDPLKTPFATAYVEVNSNSFANAGCYQYGPPARQLFSVAVIFAANINATGGKPTLYFNPQVQAELDAHRESGQRAAVAHPGLISSPRSGSHAAARPVRCGRVV